MRLRFLAVLPVVLVLACGAAADDGTGIDRGSFIDVVVDLRRAAQASPDAATFEARKQEILRGAGVTEDQLRRYVQAHSRDFEHMAAVWESINVRLAIPEEM